MPPKAIVDLRQKLMARMRIKLQNQDRGKHREELKSFIDSVPEFRTLTEPLTDKSISESNSDFDDDSDSPTITSDSDDPKFQLGRSINEIGTLRLRNFDQESTVADVMGSGMAVVILLRQFG